MQRDEHDVANGWCWCFSIAGLHLWGCRPPAGVGSLAAAEARAGPAAGAAPAAAAAAGPGEYTPQGGCAAAASCLAACRRDQDTRDPVPSAAATSVGHQLGTCKPKIGTPTLCHAPQCSTRQLLSDWTGAPLGKGGAHLHGGEGQIAGRGWRRPHVWRQVLAAGLLHVMVHRRPTQVRRHWPIGT